MGKKNKGHPRNQSEIVGLCVHPQHAEKVTWEKARRKCLKFYNNKCQYFRDWRKPCGNGLKQIGAKALLLYCLVMASTS